MQFKVANNPQDVATKESFDEIVCDIYLIEKAKAEGARKAQLTPKVKEARTSKKISVRQSKMDTTEVIFAKNSKDNENPLIKFANLQQLINRITYEKYPGKLKQKKKIK